MGVLMAISMTYSLRDVEIVRQILVNLKDDGIVTLDEAIDSVSAVAKTEHAELKKRVVPDKMSKSTHICPECGHKMVVYPVNISLSTLVEGEYTKVLICGSCLYEEWT